MRARSMLPRMLRPEVYQAIHANSGKTYYCRYPLAEFSFSRKSFHVKLGPNTFSSDGINLELDTIQPF